MSLVSKGEVNGKKVLNLDVDKIEVLSLRWQFETENRVFFLKVKNFVSAFLVRYDCALSVAAANEKPLLVVYILAYQY